MAELRYSRSQERVSNRYLGSTSQLRVWDGRKKRFCWVSMWNFQKCNTDAVYMENPPPGSDSFDLVALTKTGRYEEPVENIKLQHWGVK